MNWRHGLCQLSLFPEAGEEMLGVLGQLSGMRDSKCRKMGKAHKKRQWAIVSESHSTDRNIF